MNLLLTSSGIKNKSIHDALVHLLGKPIAESNALFIPTAIYPFPGGLGMAWQSMFGKSASSLCQLGWKSLGVLELTALPSIDKKAWVPSVENTDALLFWGGDPLYLSYWMRESGLTDLMKSLRREMVYVGVSAGSMVASSTFGEILNLKDDLMIILWNHSINVFISLEKNSRHSLTPVSLQKGSIAGRFRIDSC